MKQTTNYVSPEVERLTLTEWGVLCTSDQFDPNQFDAGQNEGITEKGGNYYLKQKKLLRKAQQL